MDANWRLRILTISCLLVGHGWCQASEPAPVLTPKPWQDDAALRAVQFVGSTVAYAAGDQGAVWSTRDGGQTWTFRPTPSTASFRSICFLTDRLGWVAGWELQPHTRVMIGVLFRTDDGGETWQPIAPGQLPGLIAVRFFDPEEGLAVCRRSVDGASSLFRTSDGGATWQPVEAGSGSWRSAVLQAPDSAILAADDGRIVLMAGEQLLTSKLPPLLTRRLQGLSVQPDDSAWLVGDGGLVLQSATGGVVWQASASPLPNGIRDVFDFYAVDHRGSHVWIAGQPGSVIWHSPDAGRSWQAHATGQTVPIYGLRFAGNGNGLSVGALGTILRSTDHGATWQAVRGQQRRTALLEVVLDPQQFRPEPHVQWSGESGYRSVVLAPIRTMPSSSLQREDALHAALTRARGSAISTGWRLEIDLPELQRDASRLLTRWQSRTEGRLASVFVDDLVRDLRTWRPNVVVLPAADEHDAAAQLLRQAVTAAVEQAGDATRAVPQAELAQLGAWKVDRIIERLPTGHRGEITLDPQTFLPSWEASLHLAAADSRGLGGFTPTSLSAALAYRWQNKPANAGTPRDPFGGLDLPPNSAARRKSLPITEDRVAELASRFQQQRNFVAIADRLMADPRQSPQLLAQLPNVLRTLTPAQSAATLAEVGSLYRQSSQWESAEATFRDLIRRHPQEPAALDAMRWLVQYWTSEEVSYQRLRQQGASAMTVSTDPEQQRRQAEAASTADFTAAPVTFQDVLQKRVTPVSARQTVSPRLRQNHAIADDPTRWWSQASELAEQIEVQAPALFRQPEIQLPLAALRRARGSAHLADNIYRSYATSPTNPVHDLAERELWLGHASGEVPRQVATCRRVTKRPQLDGVLSDECWQDAREIRLGDTDEATSPDSAAPKSLVFFSYDAEFLYLAASIPRHADGPTDPPDHAGRTFDSDLGAFDRLSLAIDIDRDYTTWYELHVDQRGWTQDRCWHNAGWNPHWFVAADAEDDRWRIEAAIPWSELTGHPPRRREVWAIGLVRMLPAIHSEGWGASTAWPPPPTSFGLLRFE